MLGTVKQEKIRWRNVNIRLIICVIIISIIGVMVVNSASANEVSNSVVSTTTKQIIGMIGGIILMIIVSLIDYEKICKYSWALYILILLVLVYVLFFTKEIYGAKRWIYIPFFGTIQPSEFFKPVLIVFSAFLLGKFKDHINKIQYLLAYFLILFPGVILVLREPDLSTTIVLLFAMIALLFVAGISYKWVVGTLCILVPVAALFIFSVYQEEQPILNAVFEEHQVERINGFFFPEQYPDQVYQQNNSVMAIGSGGLTGKGLNNSSLESVKNGNFLSEEQSDFIFAIVGEELGFAGSVIVVLLLLFIVFECFLTAWRCREIQGKLVAAGVGATIGIQAFINMGVATLVLPNTGIPLPFVSAGLSSLLSNYLMIGLVICVGLHGSKRGITLNG